MPCMASVTRGSTDPLPFRWCLVPGRWGWGPVAWRWPSIQWPREEGDVSCWWKICSPHGAEMNEFCVASIFCICLSRKTYHANLVCCNYIGTQWPIWCSDLLKFQKTMSSLEDSRHETTDETGTTPRFKLIDPNHAWKRFNHEKNIKKTLVLNHDFGLFRQHVY